MTKENILAKLKNKYGNLGLSDELMGSQSDFILALNPTEENIDSMVDSLETTLKSFQSNLDKARAAAAKPKPAEQPKPDVKPTQEEMPTWAQQLLSTVQSLQSQQSARSKTDSLVQKLEAEKIPSNFYGRFLKTLDFENDYDETATVESFKNDFNDFKQSFANEAASGITPPMQAPQNQKASAIRADIERLAKD